MDTAKQYKKRILLVDDNQAIHEDFKKILRVESEELQFNEIETELFGKKEKQAKAESYVIDSAFQGEDAIETVKKSKYDNKPFCVAFIDVRMPPGIDGIITAKKIWEVDADIQIVICTAYADYSWSQIVQELGNSNNFLILKKPFDVVEIRQLAASLSSKWELKQEITQQINSLEAAVVQRTGELDKTLSLTKATLEATPEGIIAISKEEHKVITWNKVFLNSWNVSENILKSEKSFAIFQRLAKQVEESALFLKIMNNLCDQPIGSDHMKEWKLISGNVMEIDVQPQYLQDQIVGTVFCFRDITERKQLEEQLLYQATHDNLTRLPNRVLLLDRIEQAIANAKRASMYVGIILIDLDNFKEVNESLGHTAGDALLIRVSERLKNSIRDIDTLVRLGGDEFVIVLVSQSREESILIKAKELIEVFASPCEIENHTITVTVSIGVSFYPQDGQDANSLLKNADAALYHAKEIGKNTFQVYMSEFNEHLLQRAELITALRQAIDKKQLLLYYQPLIKSDNNRIIGSESLIRWQHPFLGMLMPQTFISLAEETGLIIPIGDWVLKEACLQTKKWQQTINPELSIAINISSYQFVQKDFVDKIKKVLQETGLEPQYLELEMTESHIFKSIPDTAEKMHQLKALGLRLSIDDFGTGYASFSYLKYFPFDKVKIDKTFIKGIHVDSNDDAIVEAIINMTKKMGIEVLAEGVETPEQIAFLMSHHGNQMQGYYYSPPLDVDEFAELLIKDMATVKQSD